MLKVSALAIFMAALLSSCVTTTLAPEAESVRVTTNADVVVKGCRYIGEAKAKDRMNGGLVGQDAAEENTYRRLKNEAAAMGGNVVHLNRAETSGAGSSARGEVYSCETTP